MKMQMPVFCVLMQHSEAAVPINSLKFIFGDGRWPGIDHVLYHMSKCEKDVGNYQSPGVKGETTVSCSGDC